MDYDMKNKMGENILRAAEGVMRMSEEVITANGWPDGRPMYLTMMEGSQ